MAMNPPDEDIDWGEVNIFMDEELAKELDPDYPEEDDDE